MSRAQSLTKAQTIIKRQEESRFKSKSQTKNYSEGLSNGSQITNFLETLQNNKEAMTLFKEEAIRRGIYKETPLPIVHHTYYSKYIKPSIDGKNSAMSKTNFSQNKSVSQDRIKNTSQLNRSSIVHQSA